MKWLKEAIDARDVLCAMGLAALTFGVWRALSPDAALMVFGGILLFATLRR